MKVVFDTNVLISGFLTETGISQHVFTAGLKRHQVILSEFILDEMKQKLTGKLEIAAAWVEPLLLFLRKRTTVLKVPSNPRIQFTDKKDVPILSLLEICKPHYLITGDKLLQGLKRFGPTLILSPREAAEIL